MAAGDESSTVVVVVDGDVEIIVARLAGDHADLGMVDALARLQLAARRLGCSIRLREPSAGLFELLELVGLSDVIGGPGGLRLEAGREAEVREQLGIEEVVQPGDPPV